MIIASRKQEDYYVIVKDRENNKKGVINSLSNTKTNYEKGNEC